MSDQYSLVLVHHGIKGQKLGVRKKSYYTPTSARGYGKQINKADKARTKATSQYIKNDLKSRKIAKKADNYFNKIDSKRGYDDGEYRVTPLSGKDNKHIGKMMNQSYMYNEKAKRFKEVAAKNEARANALIADAKIKGYAVSSKDVLRYANKGKRIAISMSGVGISAIRNRNRRNISEAGDQYKTMYRNNAFYQNRDVTVGTKYNVSSTKKSRQYEQNNRKRKYSK